MNVDHVISKETVGERCSWVSKTGCERMLVAPNLNDHEQKARVWSGVACWIVVVPAMEPRGLPHRLSRQCGNAEMVPQTGYSAGATACARAFSTSLTRKAITAVAKTKPSAMAAVVVSTRPKPPRP